MKTRVGGQRVMRELLGVGLTVVSKPWAASDFSLTDKYQKKYNTSTCVEVLYYHWLDMNPYLISTSAPASSNAFFKPSASSLEMPSLRALGAASTNSLASFNPRLASSFTSLTTANF